MRVGSLWEDYTTALDMEHTCTSSAMSRLVMRLIDIRGGVRDVLDGGWMSVDLTRQIIRSMLVYDYSNSNICCDYCTYYVDYVLQPRLSPCKPLLIND